MINKLILAALTIAVSSVISADTLRFDSLEKIPKVGVVEGVLKDDNLYILSSSIHSIPEGINRTDGERIALEISTIQAKSNLAEYMRVEFDKSKIYDELVTIIDNKAHVKKELKEQIITDTKAVVLRRVQTIGQIQNNNSVRVIVGISEKNFLDQIR